MASENSFDIVSDFDRQELINALDQARRDVGTRYDLKDTGTVIDLTQTELSITTDTEMSLRSVRDIIETKMLRRNLSLKILDFGTAEDVSGGRVKQTATLRKGIDTELAKKLQKLIRDQFPKVQGRIQGDTLRIVSKSRDELQAVIQFMREQEGDLPMPLQYTNYR
ncbi:MAG: YajQ family cyclic di-GMP-binding protein [Chloroflexaceae bacterium]|nr:YajQ family cyclic di-GMP-binding protein [Chloroflexaceae bacterium]